MKITDHRFELRRDEKRIQEETLLDGIYVIRAKVSPERFPTDATVRAYKGLSSVERAFRSMKTIDLKVRPIHHRKEERVRAHVFLCMLAYYVEWHMRRALSPMLFDDDDKPAGEALRTSIVAPAKRSPRAEAKASTKRTEDGSPIHSFQTLLRDLATIAKNLIQPKADGVPNFEMVTRPTSLQSRAHELLKKNVPEL